MNMFETLLDKYTPSDLYIDRIGYVDNTSTVDFALLRHSESRQAVWFDRDIGFRIASYNNDSKYSCFIETIFDTKVAFQIDTPHSIKRIEFELSDYSEEEYFQLSLIHDLSEFSYTSYTKFYEIYTTCTNKIKEHTHE